MVSGPAGTPQIDFHLGACTFCGACADACSEPVYSDTALKPWKRIATVSSECLLARGIECRSCTDMCEPSALRFDLRIRPVGGIALDIDSCTGCGACVAGCPVAAISIESSPEHNQ